MNEGARAAGDSSSDAARGGIAGKIIDSYF
jgi:hypothetical protein